MDGYHDFHLSEPNSEKGKLGPSNRRPWKKRKKATESLPGAGVDAKKSK